MKCSNEFGMDGYTADLNGDDNKPLDTLISRDRMKNEYKLLKAGDKI